MKCPRCRKSQKCGSHSGKAEPLNKLVTVRFASGQMTIIKQAFRKTNLSAWIRKAVLNAAGLRIEV